MKEVIVWKVLDWAQSQQNDALFKRVAFKPTDGSKQVYLNLTQNCEVSKWKNWEPYLKEGNVLKVTMHPNGNVAQFQPFTVVQIKDKNKEA